VQRYTKVFWNRIEELPDHDKLVASVEKGEQKISKKEAMQKALIVKIESAPNAWYSMNIPVSSNRSQYSKEEDAFLLCMTYKHGYGNWDAIKASIASHWQFRFDWFFQSRSTIELSRRVDALLRLLEKEISDGSVNVDKHMAHRPAVPASRKKPTILDPPPKAPSEDVKADPNDVEMKDAAEEKSLKRTREAMESDTPKDEAKIDSGESAEAKPPPNKKAKAE